MKAESVGIYGAMAAVGLIAAYVTWQRGPEQKDRGEIVALDVSKKALQKVRFEDARKWIELSRDPNDDERVSVTEATKPPPPPAPASGSDLDTLARMGHGGMRPNPDGGMPLLPDGQAVPGARPAADAGTSAATATATATAPDAGTPAATVAASASAAPVDAGTPAGTAEVMRVRVLRGNEQAVKAFEAFSPLLATRDLGVLDAKKLEELGLKDSQRSVKVTTPSGAESFVVAYPPGGLASAYFKSERSGKVYLMKGQVLSDLEYASSRLVDRRLHDFQLNDAQKVVVTHEGKIRRFNSEAGKLAPEENAGQPDEYARNWHDRLWKLTAIELLGQGETPPDGEPKPELKVEYAAKGKPLGFLEVGRSGQSLFVRTEHTAGWVRPHTGIGDILLESKKVTEGR